MTAARKKLIDVALPLDAINNAATGERQFATDIRGRCARGGGGDSSEASPCQMLQSLLLSYGYC